MKLNLELDSALHRPFATAHTLTSPAHLRSFMRYFVLVIVQWKDAKMCCSSLPCCLFSALLLSQLLMLSTVAVEDSVVSGLGNLEKLSTLLCTIEVLFVFFLIK